MKNKNVYISAGVIVLVLVLFFVLKPGSSIAPSSNPEQTDEKVSVPKSGASKSVTPNTSAGGTVSNKVTIASKPTAPLPEIDFLDNLMTVLPLKNYPNVKITVTQVVIGRGKTLLSETCSGIPNTNFTFLYPKSNLCLTPTEVDGSPRAILAFHLLVENNSAYNFGGTSDILRLNYPRTTSSKFQFASPLIDLGGYTVSPYSSKKIILSYSVPEDQLVYNLVSGYKEPSVGTNLMNIFEFADNGLQVNFADKSIKVIK